MIEITAGADREGSGAAALAVPVFADRAWGHMPRLSISMDDSNRVLLLFDLGANLCVATLI